MSRYPEDFTPDLRRLKSWPSMEDSPWRQPYLADLTYGELHRLVDEFIVGQGLRILDLGCGTGFLSLELAREGHEVTGLDSDEESIEIARRTMESDPDKSERGKLDYVIEDFSTWKSGGAEYDLVTLSRVLHHLPDPGQCLSKIRQILRDGGRLVCVDFAYDQFDRKTAKWMYNVRRVLEQAGWYKSEHKLSEDPDASTKQLLDEWFEEYEKKEHLNRFEEMRKPLYESFREEHFSWEPYLYWEIIGDMRIPSNDAELAFSRSVSGMERFLIESNAIKPLLFCFVGEKPR